jgi:hypothetical protein
VRARLKPPRSSGSVVASSGVEPGSCGGASSASIVASSHRVPAPGGEASIRRDRRELGIGPRLLRRSVIRSRRALDPRRDFLSSPATGGSSDASSAQVQVAGVDGGYQLRGLLDRLGCLARGAPSASRLSPASRWRGPACMVEHRAPRAPPPAARA